jgi:PAS domain S-box-containing protein
MNFVEADVLRAFEEDEFYPVFQPIVELRTGQLAGLEVLARWRHKRLGLIGPDEFIPLVERNGLIDRLTRAILKSALASPALAGSALTLSVNISPTQLLRPRLPERIAELAAESNFPLNRLMIEITESALLDDLSYAQGVARDLKALSCRLALDDFGTGYSSLQHLSVLPFDELKVDRSFVSSMTLKRESRKIVAAVVGLGQSLGLTTVAEGVETQEQADMLVWLGCDMCQGWLYGRPVPASELPRVIAEAERSVTVAPAQPAGGSLFMSTDLAPTQRLAQWQAIYDGAPVGLCLLDRNMRYISLNRRLAQLNGVPAAAHLGKTVAEVIPHIFPLVEPFIRRALQGEPVTGVEMQKPPAPDGGEGQAVLLSYQPARDEGGEVIGVSVAIMDITGSKRVEQALAESENHYRHMMQLNPHVPWVLDRNGEVSEASSRWESLTGQSMEDAMGNGWQKMLHPEDVPATREAIKSSLRDGAPIDIEYRVRGPGGEWKWMRSRGAPRFGPTGKVICIYGVVEEVDGQKQITEELENCQAELRAAVNAVPIGMILADAQDCSIYMVNPEAERIFQGAVFAGQKLAEYSRLGLARGNGGEPQPEELPLARTMLRGETVTGRNLLYKRPDGTQVRLELSCRPIHSADSTLIGGLMMIRDLGAAE